MTTTPSERSSRRKVWNPPTRILVLITSSVAMVLFSIIGLQQVAGVVTTHNNFPRVRVPGEGRVNLRTGTLYIWLETNPRQPVKPGTMEVRLTSNETGEVIPIRASNYKPRVETYGRKSTLLGETRITKTGAYRLAGEGGGGNTLVIGRMDEGFLLGWAVLWFALAGLSLMIAIVSGVLVFARTTKS